MAKSPVTTHVDDFLFPIDPRGGFLTIAERIIEAADHDLKLQASIGAIKARLDKHNEDLRRLIPQPSAPGDILGGPAEKQLLVVCYLRAIEALRGAATTTFSSSAEINKRLHIADRLLKGIEPGFIVELLMVSERRASFDPVFARTLEDAEEDLRWISSHLSFLLQGNPSFPGAPKAPLAQEPQQQDHQPYVMRTLNEQLTDWMWFMLLVTIGAIVEEKQG